MSLLKKRNLGIDLLRIISMYMIVILHVLGQGGILFNLEIFSNKYNIAWILEIICFCSVNLYGFITGYVMTGSKFKYKKIINLWISVIFWSVLLTITMSLIYPNTIDKRDIIKSFFPVIYNEYWYFSSYVLLFFCIPFISKFIDILDKATYKKLLITIIFFMSIVGIVYDPFVIVSGNSFIWLFVLYIIGAYIKKYGLFNNIKSIYIFFLILLMVGLTFLIKCFILKNPYIFSELLSDGFLVKHNSFTILFASILIFVMLIRLKLNNKYLKRFIKRLSPATFGVYIIHVHSWVWVLFMQDRFKSLINYNSIIMILLVLFYAFMIYMLCSYLEMIRIYIFKKFKINKIENFIYKGIKKIYFNIF